jgi:hypothetical protein
MGAPGADAVLCEFGGLSPDPEGPFHCPLGQLTMLG